MNQRTFKKLFNIHICDKKIRNKDILEKEIFKLINFVEKDKFLPSWQYLNENHSAVATFIKNYDKSIKSFFSNYFSRNFPYQKKKKSIEKKDRSSLFIEEKRLFNRVFIDQTILEIKRFNDMSALYRVEVLESLNDDIEFVSKSFILALEQLEKFTVLCDKKYIIDLGDWKKYKKVVYDTHKTRGELSLYNSLYLRYKKNIFNELIKEFNITIKEQ